jgi:uncharacterized protein YbcI
MADASPVGGKLLTEVSNAMVALHRDHFGRGPGAARSFVTDDVVVCTLSDVYTQVEKTLIRAGKVDRVRETRIMHQLALEAEFKEPIERLTGRKVIAFVSSVHFDPDLAVELFVLEPKDQSGYSPDGMSAEGTSPEMASGDGASADGASRKSSTE